MKKNKKLLWLILVLLAMLFVGWMFVRWWNRDVVTIKTAIAVKAPIEQVVSASGKVDAPVFDLGPKMGGKVVKINVREGQYVNAGMTLAEFDDTTRLVAPSNGLVAKINVDEGETSVSGTAAITMVDYSRSWVEAQVDEIDIANVKIGDKVKITSDVYSDKSFNGIIYWIAPLAELRKVGGRIKLDEESYVFIIKIRFLGRHEELKANMTVNVDIITKSNPSALVVPRESVLSKDDCFTVFKINKNRVEQTNVALGIRSFTSVEVTAGLIEGDWVAINNGAKLKDKGRIKVEK